MELLKAINQIRPMEIGPFDRSKDKFGIGVLVKQEVGKPLLTRGSNHEIHIRQTGSIKIVGEKALIDGGDIRNHALLIIFGNPFRRPDDIVAPSII